MFDQKNIIEFINKLINQVDEVENKEVEENLKKFRAYLELTQMCDGETLANVDKVLECYDSLIDLKTTFGFVDVSSLFLKEKEIEGRKLVKKRPAKPVRPVRPPKDEYEDKHYRHYSSSYHEPVASSGCGGSVSYSSGCGCGSSYRSGC